MNSTRVLNDNTDLGRLQMPRNQEKRKYITTGSTPSKPEIKRNNVLVSETPTETAGKSRKRLSFKSSSPNQKIASSLAQKALRKARGLKSLKQLTFSPKHNKKSWTVDEDTALVQFVALHRDLQPTSSEWPSMRPNHPYWEDAVKFIEESTKTPYKRAASTARQRVVIHLKGKYQTVDEAESDLGITVERYLDGPIFSDKQPKTRLPTHLPLTKAQQLQVAERYFESLNEDEQYQLLKERISSLPSDKHQMMMTFLASLPENNEHAEITANKLFLTLATGKGISTNPGNYVSLSLLGMKRLEENGKPNLLYNFSCCLGNNRKGLHSPLLPIDRMPYGLIEYTIQFYASTDTRKLSVPHDYHMWLQTMETEFPSRFHRLFTGPMWSGQDKSLIGNPEKARVNVPAPSLTSNWRHSKKDALKVTPSPGFQPSALDALKKANPEGRFWVKIDGTDIKEGLMESMKGKWNGDQDLCDEKVQQLREEYDKRLESLQHPINKKPSIRYIGCIIEDLKEDSLFLVAGLQKAQTQYREKYNAKNSKTETLKNLSWEVVEYQTLLTQAQELQVRYESLFTWEMQNNGDQNASHMLLRQLESESKTYLKNLFKKKRQAADHVVVWMVSDERRNTKPYALPVGYVPCGTLKDQYVRDLTKPLKEEMKKRDLTLVGTVTDGEYCTLRSQGETRPLNLWQIVHDSKESVKKMSQKTLLDMLILQRVTANGVPVVQQPNQIFPNHIILELHRLHTQDGLSLEDAITSIRGKLVPDGYTPYPFCSDTPETLLHKLRSIAATSQLRNTIQYWKERGVDFSIYLYIPEVDPVTNLVRHDRGDHNHILKRIGKSTREGHNTNLQFDAFDNVLKDAESGLTHAALMGVRKQSVQDVERLFSVHVVKSLRRHGYSTEADYVEVIANWHEASDGRGLSQLQRCRYNYKMLNYILDELMPWHKENYDFSTIDVNRPWEYVCGFSRETLIEVTTNIESQEARRRQNHEVGYSEHPRAGSTDDLENFFAIIHRLLGPTFTLKQFHEIWGQVVREFTKKMDATLPFYYYTLNDRFRDEELPSFDECPAFEEEQVELRTHPLRLHRLRLNHREDSAIFAAGRNFLPTRNKCTIRSQMHRPVVGLPPIPL